MMICSVFPIAFLQTLTILQHSRLSVAQHLSAIYFLSLNAQNFEICLQLPVVKDRLLRLELLICFPTPDVYTWYIKARLHFCHLSIFGFVGALRHFQMPYICLYYYSMVFFKSVLPTSKICC